MADQKDTGRIPARKVAREVSEEELEHVFGALCSTGGEKSVDCHL